MNFSEFLKLTQVLRMLYGQSVAIDFFQKNASLYYNLDLSVLMKPGKLDSEVTINDRKV